MLIPSHPPFFGFPLHLACLTGQRFAAQEIFLFTQIILLRKMPCCDIKAEENKAGDVINELPVEVGMSG